MCSMLDIHDPNPNLCRTSLECFSFSIHGPLWNPFCTSTTMADRIQSWDEDLKKLQNEKGVETNIHILPPADKETRLSSEIKEYLEQQGEVRGFFHVQKSNSDLI